MPYSKKAKYTHHRQRKPSQCIKGTHRTVKLSHSGYKGKKYKKPGAKAVVCKLKKKYRKPAKRGGKPRAWGTQSILNKK